MYTSFPATRSGGHRESKYSGSCPNRRSGKRRAPSKCPTRDSYQFRTSNTTTSASSASASAAAAAADVVAEDARTARWKSSGSTNAIGQPRVGGGGGGVAAAPVHERLFAAAQEQALRLVVLADQEHAHAAASVTGHPDVSASAASFSMRGGFAASAPAGGAAFVVPVHERLFAEQLRRDVRSVERKEAAREREAAALSEARGAARARKSADRDAAAAAGGGRESASPARTQVFSRLYQTAEKKRAAALAAAAAAERLLEEEEIAACTFQPKISRRAEQMEGTEGDVFDRLNKDLVPKGSRAGHE